MNNWAKFHQNPSKIGWNFSLKNKNGKKFREKNDLKVL